MQTIDSLVEQAARGRIFRREAIAGDDVLRAVRRHHEVLAGGAGGAVVKREAKTNVTLLAWPGATDAPALCVKEFVRSPLLRLVPALIRHRPARDSWRAALELERRGLPAAATLAAVLGRGRRSYVIMKNEDRSEHLWGYVQRALGPQAPRARRLAFLRAAADALNRCYRADVFHRDLKAGNVLVRETPDGWAFLLLDLAAVRAPWRVRPADKWLNLAQLNSSTPLELTWTDRLRFVRALAAEDPALGQRPALQAVTRLTRARRCVWLS